MTDYMRAFEAASSMINGPRDGTMTVLQPHLYLWFALYAMSPGNVFQQLVEASSKGSQQSRFESRSSLTVEPPNRTSVECRPTNLYQERKSALLIDYSMSNVKVGTSFARSFKLLLVKCMENQHRGWAHLCQDLAFSHGQLR